MILVRLILGELEIKIDESEGRNFRTSVVREFLEGSKLFWHVARGNSVGEIVGQT